MAHHGGSGLLFTSCSLLLELNTKILLQVTSQIVSAIMAAQKIDFVEGDAIAVPGTDEKVFLPRKVNLAELSR